MRDQADKLRLKMLETEGKLARSVAIVSGKGGVGKSNFTTNFAYALQAKGKRVIIVDMDIGMGNVHILLGQTPRHNLNDYLVGKVDVELVITHNHDSVPFISGGSGLDSVLEWSESMFERLIGAFQQLQQQYDVILFDMGAGATQRSIELIIAVDEIIVISTTEPTSITDAYSMMKFICLRDADKTMHLVSNRVSQDDDGNEAATRLQFAMRKFLHKEIHILGFLPEDRAVHQAVLAQQPFIRLFPNASISKRLLAITYAFVGEERKDAYERSIGFLGKLRSLFKKGRE